VRVADLDDIDWAALEHAYGSAEDVPEILAALRCADPDQREWALDRFYVGVHHQSDVYDSTVACMPFLVETLLSPNAGDRVAIAELLASICRCGADDLPDGLEPGADDACLAYVLQARAVLNGYLPQLRTLLADPDPALRREAPYLLAGCTDWWPRAVGDLLPLIPEEPDPVTRAALIELAVLVAGHQRGVAPPAQLVTRLARWALTGDPVTRLAALGGLLALDQRAQPGTVVDAVVDAVAELDGVPLTGPSAPAPDGPPAGPYSIHRRLAATGDGDAEFLIDLWYRIDVRLGDRVAERTALLLRLFDAAQPEIRAAACASVRYLVNEWPGAHLELLAALLDLVFEPDGAVRNAALVGVSEVGPAFAPLVDSVLAALDRCDRHTEAPAALRGTDRVDGPWLDLRAAGPPVVSRLLRAAAASRSARPW
jgi:hypothetical protein